MPDTNDEAVTRSEARRSTSGPGVTTRGVTGRGVTGRGVTGRRVLVAGATSAAGLAVVGRLAAAGAHVIAAGSDPSRLQRVRDLTPDAATYPCDLGSWPAVEALAVGIHREQGTIDGLIHLVGGWRGGGGLAGQGDEDWQFLHDRIVNTLRHTTRAFNDDLLASSAGRLAIVSSVTVQTPTPSGANYAAAKAAAETWTRAVGRGFASAGATAAAVIFVVRALDGLEGELADRVTGLWEPEAASLNNASIRLDDR